MTLALRGLRAQASGAGPAKAFAEELDNPRHEPRDNGHETEFAVSLKYNPPLGKVGAVISAWLGADPTRMLNDDLQNFKRQVEAGQLLDEFRSTGTHA